MEIITTSSRGQIVIPEKIRKKYKIKEGTKLVLFEKRGKLILQKEEKLNKMLERMDELEEKGWQKIAEESLKEVWDNEQDEKVWKKYLKKK